MNTSNQSSLNTPLTILIADDDQLIQATLKSGLVDAGFDVIMVEDGRQALDYCLNNQPDLAILDIEIPHMSGLKVAEQLVSRQTTVPFMFLSAFDSTALVDAANDLGAIGFMVKPLTINQMIPDIKIALERDSELKKLQQSEADLKASLEKTKIINLAVGIIIARYHLSSQEAFEQLRNLARSERRKLVDVANEIMIAESLLHRLKPEFQ